MDYSPSLALRSSVQARSFKDLVPFNHWAAAIATVIGGLVVSFFLFGYFWPYWRIADADTWLAYNAFLLNSDLPQEFFDHPGYLTILLLSAWLRLLHDIGLLDIYSLSTLMAAGDPNHAWTAAIRAGRILSLLMTLAFVFGFAALLRRLVGDWRVAAVGAFAVAFSGGVVTQARIIRTELISGGLVALAVLILLIAAKRTQTKWRPAMIGLATLFATLALVNKVQAIFLICAMPLIVMPFGEAGNDNGGFWRTSPLAPLIAAVAVAGAILISIPAVALVHFGMTEAATSIFRWQPVLIADGTYQPILIAWIVAGVIAFAWWWRIPATETITTLAFITAATALGLLSLDIRYQPQNVLEVINPLEQLTMFTDGQIAESGGHLSVPLLLQGLLRGFGVLLATRSFVIQSSARPTIFLEWLVIAAAIVAWKHNKYRLVAQAATLMGAVWAFDILGSFRGLQSGYFIYTDPLVVIAMCLLLAGCPHLQAHPRAYQIGIVLIIAHILVGQSLPVNHTLGTDKPLYLCIEHFGYTKRIDLMPFCPKPS